MLILPPVSVALELMCFVADRDNTEQGKGFSQSGRFRFLQDGVPMSKRTGMRFARQYSRIF